MLIVFYHIIYIWLFVYGDGDPNGASFPSGAWVWGNFIPDNVNGEGDGMIGNRWGCCRYPHRGLSPLPSLELWPPTDLGIQTLMVVKNHHTFVVGRTF